MMKSEKDFIREGCNAWMPNGNPVKGIPGNLAGRAGFEAGAQWQAARQQVAVPNDAAFRARVADLLHLLQFAEITTPTPTDAAHAEICMNDLETMISAAPQQAAPTCWTAFMARHNFTPKIEYKCLADAQFRWLAENTDSGEILSADGSVLPFDELIEVIDGHLNASAPQAEPKDEYMPEGIVEAVMHSREVDCIGMAIKSLRTQLDDQQAEQAVEPLDVSMRAAGMMTIEEMLAGAPLDNFIKHAGVNDLETYGQWLDMKCREFLTMQAKRTLNKDPEDEMYEWVLAHAAVFQEARINFKAARKAPLKSAVSALVEALEDIVSIYESGESFRHVPMYELAITALAAHKGAGS